MQPDAPSFRGELFFLSNFYPREIEVEGRSYPSVEHYYQAMKFSDQSELMKRVRLAKGPKQAKHLGKSLRMTHERRTAWELRGEKINVMREALKAKFLPNTALALRLITTPDHLLTEKNFWHDTFWGTCHCQKCKGKGQDMLGQLLRERKAKLLRQHPPFREQRIDILSDRVLSKADAICFTSNGIVKSNGELVMGAGVARAFRDEFPGLARLCGKRVKENGSLCQVMAEKGKFCPPAIVAFPTKYHFREKSDPRLIRASCERLMQLVERHGWKLVALPRPGCRNGGLSWEREVRPTLRELLDRRVVVVSL